jgi:hypothetical protein
MARESKRHRDERRFGKPERLVDRAINGRWVYPSWYRPEDAETVEALNRYRQQVIEDLGRAVVVVADNVGEYFYAGNPKEEWHIETDFPCCAPPHDLMFIEMCRPSRILSEGKVIGSEGLPDLWGWLFHFNTIDEIRRRMQDHQFKEMALKALHHQLAALFPKVDMQAIEAAYRSGGTDGIGKLGPAEQSFFALSLQYGRLSQGTIEPGGLPEGVRWGAEGELITSVGDKICLATTTKLLIDETGKIMGYPLISILGGLQVDAEMNGKLGDTFNPMSFPAFLTLSFMHCKNVTTEAVEPDRDVNRERRKQGLKPFVRYHTIDIEPMKRVLRTEGKVESTGLKRALHICRGHFSTYTEERPLFGKLAGTFWVPAHVRGSLEEGAVVSDYKVGSPSGAKS